ncbi:MAG: AAA family ATPase [Acidobacteria bacterium]|nr:AAA family ATPase [Acidobacteriota bacterium]
MRPVRLEAEGFTCYRDRQAPLDFSGLSLFAIAGPTGAGKSSILDTMLFALYGEVPRIGKQGIGEFIAHGRDAMSVSLDFTVRGATYRVVRRVRRGRKNLTTQATLAERTSGPERSLADGVKPVNEAIERLLGLDFDAFTQTVILPQGEFARFLKADPKDQRSILQHLLRHDVFTRMREEAERRRGAFERELKGLDGQLQAFVDATPEAWASRCDERDAVHATLADLAQRRAAAEEQVKEVRARRALTAEADQLREQRAGLERESEAVQAMRAELAAARKAGAVLPRIERVAECDAQHGRAISEREDAAAAVSSARTSLSRAEQALANADASSERCAVLRQRVTAIDEIKGDLARRSVLTTSVLETAQRIVDARRQLEAAATRAAAAREAAGRAASERSAAEQALVAVGYDRAEHDRIEELATVVTQVRGFDEELSRLQARHTQCLSELAAHEAQGRVSETAVVEAERAHASAVDKEQVASRALDDARIRNQAAAVRAHLHAGEPCPVCLQPVPALPDVPPVPELDALVAALANASTRAKDARAVLQRTAEQRAEARARIEAARAAMELSGAAVANARVARAQLLDTIVAALAGMAAGAGAVAACDIVEERRKALRASRALQETAAARLYAAESAFGAAQVTLTSAEAGHASRTQALQHLLDTERTAREELDVLRSRILAVTTHDDPAQERRELADEVDRIERTVRAAREEHAAAQLAVASAEARLTAATEAVGSAERSRADARAALDAALAEGGFASARAAHAAAIDMMGQATRERRIAAHEAQLGAVLARLVVVEPQLAGRTVSAAQLAEAERACTDAFERWREAERRHDALAAECDRLAAQVEHRIRLLREQEDIRGRLALHAGMAADLQGNAFQEYLLEEAFRDLVKGASVRLRQMSNRYTLEWQDGDFFVVDHDNAGERRRAETLSGGETFMASLCLALQLSEEVLKTSGALQMDSLFIDEGFGTLDTDALAEVTDAMEALRQDGSRLIGVISHRTELTERLPGCIRVMKGAGESSWFLERVG